MRLSELKGREIINFFDASRMGFAGEVDAEIDLRTGQILRIWLNGRRRAWFGRSESIPWTAVKKVGEDLIIVDVPSGKAGVAPGSFGVPAGRAGERNRRG